MASQDRVFAIKFEDPHGRKDEPTPPKLYSDPQCTIAQLHAHMSHTQTI